MAEDSPDIQGNSLRMPKLLSIVSNSWFQHKKKKKILNSNFAVNWNVFWLVSLFNASLFSYSIFLPISLTLFLSLKKEHSFGLQSHNFEYYACVISLDSDDCNCCIMIYKIVTVNLCAIYYTSNWSVILHIFDFLIHGLYMHTKTPNALSDEFRLIQIE